MADVARPFPQPPTKDSPALLRQENAQRSQRRPQVAQGRPYTHLGLNCRMTPSMSFGRSITADLRVSLAEPSVLLPHTQLGKNCEITP